MASKFGGVEVDQAESKFGGVPVGHGSPTVTDDSSSQQSPTWFDRMQHGATGGLLDPGGAHDDPLKKIVHGMGDSLGRTTKAWSDALTLHPNNNTAAEMIPFLGPAAVDAATLLGTPGHRMEGVGAAGALIAPSVMHSAITPSEFVNTEVPLGPGLSRPSGAPRLPEIPNAVRALGEWTVPNKVSNIAGRVYDFARSKSAAPAKTTETRIFNRNSPDLSISPEAYSELPIPSIPGQAPSVSQYGLPSVNHAVEVGGSHIPDMVIDDNAIARARPLSWTRIKPDVKPTEGKSLGAVPGQYDAPISVRPDKNARAGSSASVPDYVHPLPGPEELAARIAARKTSSVAAPVVAEDVGLLNDLTASLTGGKQFSKLNPTDQAKVRNLAASGSGGIAPMASPVEQSLPGGRAIVDTPAAAPLPNPKPDYSGITKQYQPSRTRARFDKSGKRIGG